MVSYDKYQNTKPGEKHLILPEDVQKRRIYQELTHKDRKEPDPEIPKYWIKKFGLKPEVIAQDSEDGKWHDQLNI